MIPDGAYLLHFMPSVFGIYTISRLTFQRMFHFFKKNLRIGSNAVMIKVFFETFIILGEAQAKPVVQPSQFTTDSVFLTISYAYRLGPGS